MSVFSINETISGLGLPSPKILYDFSSFNGTSEINSVDDADPLYSGEIINGNNSFTGTNSGSGFFDGQYIQIQETTGIVSEASTIIFSQEKTGVGAGTLFSNLNEPSGFELGITDANKFYYKNFVDGSPNYVTLESYPSDKNLYAFIMGAAGVGSLNRLDFKEPQAKSFALSLANVNNPIGAAPATNNKYYNFTSKKVNVPAHTVSNGDSWKIGTGDFLYKGYIDYFIYFDSEIVGDPLRKLARAVHAETTFVPAKTGLISGVATGYDVSVTDVSGVVATAFEIQGTGIPSGTFEFASGLPLTGAVGISGEVFVPKTTISGIAGTNLLPQTIYKRVTNLSITHTMTGGMQVSGLGDYFSSGSYWVFSGNSGTFEGDVGVGPVGTLFGITGFEVQIKTGAKQGIGVEQLGSSGVSGVSYSGFQFEPRNAPDIIYTGTGGYFESGPNADPSYYANALSVVGPPDPNYVYEILFDISGAPQIEQHATVVSSSTFGKGVAVMTGENTTSGSNLYINGISSFTGSLALGKNSFNLPTFQTTSGFVNSGVQAFTLTNISGIDSVVYDSVPQRSRESLTITSLSQYSSAPFSEITEANNDIFFNGVKLLEGTDYTFAGGFNPQGTVTQSTGVYFTCPAYSGDPVLQRESGRLNDAVSVYSDEITPYGYVLYFNGVRQPTDEVIEHSANSDLISGVNKNIVSGVIYKMINGITQS